MSLTRMPHGKRRVTMGLRDDSVSVPEPARKTLAPGARVLAQTGSVKSLSRDAARTALPPGKRISKTGNIYWESRKGRSDIPGTNL